MDSEHHSEGGQTLIGSIAKAFGAPPSVVNDINAGMHIAAAVGEIGFAAYTGFTDVGLVVSGVQNAFEGASELSGDNLNVGLGGFSGLGGGEDESEGGAAEDAAVAGRLRSRRQNLSHFVGSGSGSGSGSATARVTPTRSGNEPAIGSLAFNETVNLSGLSQITSSFRTKFAPLQPGWDTNADGWVNSSEAAQVLVDVGAPPSSTLAVAVRGQFPTDNTTIAWRSFLETHLPETETTIGLALEIQVQGPSQPLRAKLEMLVTLWNGLLAAAKPIVHLSSLPSPLDNSTCYGTSQEALLQARQACATNFPHGCSGANGFGLWVRNATGVRCTAEKALADLMTQRTPHLANQFQQVEALISESTTDAVAWITRQMPPTPLQQPPPDNSAVLARLDDLTTFITLTKNVIAFVNGSNSSSSCVTQCNVSNPSLEQRYLTELGSLLAPLDTTQYLMSVVAYSRSIDSAQQGLMFSQLAQTNKLIETSLLANGSLSKPRCLSSGAAPCAGDELQVALRYVSAVRDGAQQRALKLLLSVRQALVYQTLNRVRIQRDASWPALTTSADFNRAVADLDAVWYQYENAHGGPGTNQDRQFEFSKADHPDEFASLVKTGAAMILGHFLFSCTALSKA